METNSDAAGSISPGESKGPNPIVSRSHELQPSKVAGQGSQAGQKIRRRNRMITSCLECRRRKLKCDKLHPCTNCAKFSRDCVFLAPALDSASQLKLTEIKEKMGSLERVLENDVAQKKEISAQKKDSRRQATRRISAAEPLPGQGSSDEDTAAEPDDEKDLEPTPLAVPDAAYEGEGDDDDIVDLGYRLGKMRMNERIGGFFRPKMTEELSFTLGGGSELPSPESLEKSPSGDSPKPLAIQDSPSPGSSASFLEPGPTYIAPRSSFFFNANEQSVSLIDFLPSRPAADILVEQYRSAVHSIAKVVHWPSFVVSYETFWSNIAIGREPIGSLQAVCFAVMFSGIISMPEEQAQATFGLGKQGMIESFQAGTEMALGKANFLRTTKIETLQALVIYAIPMCRAEMSRAHSALVGAAVKLGECMGLHRDPSIYGATAKDTQIRRLLWYQLCILDIRTCEAQGPRPNIRREDFDTELPLNVDDADLDSSSSRPLDSPHWTDNTFARIRFECNEMHRTIWVDRVRLERKEITLTHIMAKTESFRKAMEAKYLPMLDLSVPLQRFAKHLLFVLINRMTVMVLHRYHNSVSVRMPDRLRQVLLSHGTQQMEDSVIMDTDPSFKAWSWYNGACFQYHVAFLLLVEIFAHPMRREAERIWRCLDYVFELDPSLARDQKARVILTEIRDKAAAYRSVRKTRAPVSMMQKLVAKEDKTKKDLLREQATEALANSTLDERESQKAESTSTSVSPPAPLQSPSTSQSLGASPNLDIRSINMSSQGMSAAATNSHWNFDTSATYFSRPESKPNPERVTQFNQAFSDKSPAGSVPPWMTEYSGMPSFRPGTLTPAGIPSAADFAIGVGTDTMLRGTPTPPVVERMDIDWSEWDKLFPPEVNTGDLDI